MSKGLIFFGLGEFTTALAFIRPTILCGVSRVVVVHRWLCWW